jgi:DNA-directed RNA polymerase specialized sigma24 family protein
MRQDELREKARTQFQTRRRADDKLVLGMAASGMTYKQIGVEVGIHEGTVGAIVKRARQDATRRSDNNLL